MGRLERRVCWAGVVLATAWASVTPASAGEVAFARHLAVSPDGLVLAFGWAGDIWTVAIEGGTATRLTVHPANDSHPVWSRDGQFLAFSSDRHGADNVFVMRRDGSDVRRMTFADRPEVPTDFSPDGEWVYFQARREADIEREPRIYRVTTKGGQSWRVMDCYGAEARVSADGTQIAFARGSSAWGRRGYRGSANHDIYVYASASGRFTQLTSSDGLDRLPLWDAGARGLYFLSDRGGSVNVWYQPLAGGDAEQVTRMTGDDVRDLSVSADAKMLAFTQWDRIYVMSTADRQARAISVTAGDDAAINDVELRTLTKDADEIEASPDGKEIALVVHGEIYVIKVEEDKLTRRVTDSPARDQDVTWSPDGKALFFVSDSTGQEEIYRATSAEEPPQPLSDSLRFKIEQVTDDPALDTIPTVSPDGKYLAFVRGRGDLMIRDLKTGKEACLATSFEPPLFRWSPDSRWMAYEAPDREENADVWVVPADGSKPAVNVSQYPSYDGNPQWSADGQILAFASKREGFDSDLYCVFLSRELDEKSGVELDEYFKQQAEEVKKRKPLKSAVASGKIALAGGTATSQLAETQPAGSQPTTTQAMGGQWDKKAAAELQATVRKWLKKFMEEPAKKPEKADEKGEEKAKKKPAKKYPYELETCFKRVRRVTTLPGDQERYALAPDGQLLAFISSHEGEAKLCTIKWNGKDVKRIVGESVGGLQWALDGKKLFYLKGGVPNSCSESGGDIKSHAFKAKMAVSHSAEAAQKFDDGARQMGLRFYHPTMKGLDWPALTQKYKDLALRTRTTPEFNEVFNLLLGELNSSHQGIYGPGGGGPEQIGYLGCTLDRTFAGPGLKVTAVLPRSPADRTESKLVVGDVILRVNGEPVGPERALEAALINTVGDEVILELMPSPQRPAQPPAPETRPSEDAKDAAENAEGAELKEGDEAHSEAETVPASQPTDAAKGGPTRIVIRPVAYASLVNLQYGAWVESNEKYVNKNSGGRVGYLHIRGMDEPSFRTFERDLYAAGYNRDGLIIDVRNNGGGWTADWVLAVLSVRRHAYTIPRGGEPGYPQDRLIFYAWTKPATMMCNEQSFSNAEIVAHAFKTLGRGPLVGMTTHGGVISTGAYRLIDGTTVRMPGRGWYVLPDGVDMELHGAEPDVKVPVTPEDEVLERQPQLDAAIAATLAQLEAAPAQP